MNWCLNLQCFDCNFFWQVSQLPADIRERALQPAVQVLHARGGGAPDPAAEPADHRRDRPVGPGLCPTRGRQDQTDRGRAARQKRHRLSRQTTQSKRISIIEMTTYFPNH